MVVRKKFPQVYEMEHPMHGRYWQVSARSKKWGMNQRKTFPNETSAIKYAQSIEEQLIKFGRQSNVPKEKILSAERYEELAQRLTTFGKRPEDAVEHFTLQPLQNNHYLRIQ